MGRDARLCNHPAESGQCGGSVSGRSMTYQILMKVLQIVFLWGVGLFLTVTPTHAAWTKVQQVTLAGPGTCSPTCTADFPSNTTAGNLIVIVTQWPHATLSLSSCSGDAGTGWSVIAGSFVQDATLVRAAQICYAIADGGNTVAATWSATGFQHWAIAFEYSGNATSSVLDKAGAAFDTNSQTHLTLGNLTTDTDNELLVVYAACDSAAAPTWTKATNWTAVQFTGISIYNAMADYQGAPVGVNELYITGSVGCPYVITGATFRPLSAGTRPQSLLLGVY
jgi:hypothetical protein